MIQSDNLSEETQRNTNLNRFDVIGYEKFHNSDLSDNDVGIIGDEYTDALTALQAIIRSELYLPFKDDDELTPEDKIGYFHLTQASEISKPGCSDVIFCKFYGSFGFKKIRYLLEIDDNLFANSFNHPQLGIFSKDIHSSNGLFKLRSISKEEAKVLFKILLPYYEYLKINSKSLLTRYLSLFRLTKKSEFKYYVVERIPTIFEFYKLANGIIHLNGTTRKNFLKHRYTPLLDDNWKKSFSITPETCSDIRNTAFKDVELIGYEFEGIICSLKFYENKEISFSTDLPQELIEKINEIRSQSIDSDELTSNSSLSSLSSVSSISRAKSELSNSQPNQMDKAKKRSSIRPDTKKVQRSIIFIEKPTGVKIELTRQRESFLRRQLLSSPKLNPQEEHQFFPFGLVPSTSTANLFAFSIINFLHSYDKFSQIKTFFKAPNVFVYSSTFKEMLLKQFPLSYTEKEEERLNKLKKSNSENGRRLHRQRSNSLLVLRSSQTSSLKNSEIKSEDSDSDEFGSFKANKEDSESCSQHIELKFHNKEDNESNSLNKESDKSNSQDNESNSQHKESDESNSQHKESDESSSQDNESNSLNKESDESNSQDNESNSQHKESDESNTQNALDSSPKTDVSNHDHKKKHHKKSHNHKGKHHHTEAK